MKYILENDSYELIDCSKRFLSNFNQKSDDDDDDYIGYEESLILGFDYMKNTK